MTVTQALLLAYAAGLVTAGVLLSRRVRRSSDFFVAGRGLPGGLVFVTLLAANIGAGSTVGATGLGYRHGLSAWWWSGSAAIGCLFLGLFVAPRMHRLAGERGFVTVGDFLEARFDRSVRGLVGLILWAGTLFILAGQLVAMAWALEVVVGVPKAWGCLLSGLILIAYFTGGGLLAAAWVNLLELGVLLAGFLLAVPYAWDAAGGWAILSRPGDGAYGSFTGMGGSAIAGLLAILVPSFVVSPGLVQKTFGARTPGAARGAALGNAAALALFAFVPALLGMAARTARPDLGNPELALPVLLTDVLPPWLGALGLAALFAAEISTADAVLFMLSTSLAKDLYQAYLNPDADDRVLLRVGRLSAATAGFAGVGLAILVPSVIEALRTFYGVLTMVLFAPLVVGLAASRPGPRAARGAIATALVAWAGGLVLLRGSPLGGWLPQLFGLASAFAVFAGAGLPGLLTRRRKGS
ncbi:MAG: sodium:solute symporter family protein [Acidobacteria bacterium]|nr:sodium:solute symporter family protein [Acidobacteriota bacterium]